MFRVAINGFGRIGRLVLRAGFKNKNLEFVAINDITDAATLAHLLKYDSVHRTMDAKIEAKANTILVNGKEIKAYAEKDPAKLPWKELKVDFVIESTGLFRSYDKCILHINAGAKKVIISAPSKDKDKPIKTLVMGVNEQLYDPRLDQIVSNASCTTNCVVPVAKVIHDNFKIKSAFMSTIHAYTNDQSILDQPQKDLRRARAAALSMIPTTTGAAKLIGIIFPELKGKVSGMAIRVPTADVSIIDLSCIVEKPTAKDEVNTAFKKASEGALKKYLMYLTEPLVSIDLTGNTYSAVVDAELTQVVDNNLVKVFAWYDNEYGYACRLIDLVEYMGAKL
jgi:glyceraldehyde-3-phosphate dehydrogenase type I